MSFRRLNLRQHIPGLTILFLITATTSFYALGDTLLVGFLAGEEAAGLYTASIKINKIVIPLIVSLGIVLTPRIAQSLNNKDLHEASLLAGKSFSFICLAGIPVSLGLFAFAPEIMVLFSGSGFATAIPAMQITALLPLVIGLGHLFGLQLLVSGGHEKQYLWATLFGLALSLLLNFTLIPIWQERGAAVANISTEILVTLLSLWFAGRYFTLGLKWGVAVKTLVLCLSFIPLAFWLREWIPGTVLRLGIGVGLSVFIYLIAELMIIRPPFIKELISVANARFFHSGNEA
jgi:O-antigen/teichoic acid export membrane protein